MSVFGVPLPSTLPQVPVKSGYRTGPTPNTASFQPEVGEAKARRRATSRTKPLSCTFIYTKEEVAAFEAFFDDDLADGTNRMTWMDPMRGDAADWKFDQASPFTVSAQQDSLYFDVSWLLTRLP